MGPGTGTATSSQESSPIDFDHGHPWNARDREAKVLSWNWLVFRSRCWVISAADLLGDSAQLAAADLDLRQLAKLLAANRTRDENRQRTRSS